MKTTVRIFLWAAIPGLLIACLLTDNEKLAQVAVMLMWATIVALPILGLLSLATVLLEPGTEKFKESRENYLRNGKSGFMAKGIAWLAMICTVILAAYADFIVTAVFYLLASLWVRFCSWVIDQHFKKTDAGK